MTEPDLTPSQERRLRRLLAEARHADPMPVDVAARLDEVLARLAEEEPVDASEDQPTDAGAVVELAARRRRRAASLLVAAAAVVVAGVAVGQLTGVQDDAATSSAQDQTSQTPESAGAAAEDAERKDALDTASGLRLPSAPAPDGTMNYSVRPSRDALRGAALSVRHFGHDVARLRRHLDAWATPHPFADSRAMCESADWGEGWLVAVRYQRKPAVLAFRPPSGSTQIADLLQCGSGDVLRSTTVPLR